ncbi:MAG: serine/threonine-protein kinase [Schaalia hyovaginalis]|uniref:serine/threonine-protein kinase n=1 Tax=Schaalia hyovaginalis TaxID=29316 RepID=UPI002A90BD0B|nr:serine/threonine-protein kinase [Schaalia hyovaginalis]MDY6214350.1 serine/threonine-protein kinase [Schaalia hyovaginalis]
MTSTPMTAIAPGPELPGFEWVRPLGAGGFADVHLYRQLLPSRDVAIKVVRSQTDERGAAELRREANAMTAVAGHPAIVQLYGAGTAEDGCPYLVMEYCPVSDVGDQVRARPMSIDQALDIMIQISGGVEMLHRSDVVHRDIKPTNIMLDSYGRPVLSDFGVASPVGALADGFLDGFSVLWAPPEQQDQRTHVHPTQDVWALATTTWTLLSGRSPFEDPLGDNSAVAVAARVRSGRVGGLGRADAPAQLEKVLLRAMTVDPLARTPSAAEFGRALQGIQRLMGRPVTRLEIRDPRSDGGSAQPSLGAFGGAVDEGHRDGSELRQADQGTRLRSVPSIDADRTRLRAPSFDFDSGVVARADAWKEPSSATTGRRADDPEEEPAPGRVSVWGIVALVLLAAVIIAGLVVAMLTGGGRRITLPAITPDQGNETADPIDAPPAPVTSLKGTINDGNVTWTWIGAEQSQSGTQSGRGVQTATTDHYLYTATRPGEEPVLNNIDANTVTIVGVPGENCLQVVAVSERGRQSRAVEECVTLD